MKGSIFKSTSKAGKTTWRYQIVAGRDESGKPVRLGKSGFRLEREAADAMREALQELQRGPINTTSTLGEYLPQWLDYHARAKPLSPTTAETYACMIRHVARALGKVALRELTTFQLDDFYQKLAETLSAKTIREVHGVLRVALKRAVKTRLIPHNPALDCDLPRLDPKEAPALNPAQIAAFQQAASGSWVDLIVRLAAATGARRGELLACRWADLDFVAARLRIERSLYEVKGAIGVKTTKNRQARVVAIPASLVEYLRVHQEQQARIREMFGADYRSDLDLIFTAPDGGYLRPHSVTRAASRIAKQAGTPGALHVLRHSHASGLLAAGVPITNVAARLGHRSIATTSKIYAHALPGTDKDVAEVWEKLTAPQPEPERTAQLCTTEDDGKALKN
jgi:integrase